MRLAGVLWVELFFREEGGHLLNTKERLENPIFQPELPAGVSHLPSFTSAITALRSATSWVLHKMMKNTLRLEFPGGLSLFLLYTIREQQLWQSPEEKNSPVLSSFCSPQLWLQETYPSSLVQTFPCLFLTPHAAKLKTFSYMVVFRISAPFLILWRTQRSLP